jgi:glycosyltransferase involved in cell wall biosynthesis
LRIAVLGLRGFPGVIGGIESHCEVLYPALVEKYPEFDVTVLMRRSVVKTGARVPQRLAIHALWAPRQSGWDTLVHSLLATLFAGLRLRPHVVHIHGMGPGLFTPLARLLGAQVVVTHHCRDDRRPKYGAITKWLLRLGEATAASWANKMVMVSHALSEDFQRRYGDDSGRTLTIPHSAEGVGTGTYDASVLDRLGLEPGGYFLAVGRLDASKRFHDLVEAYSRTSHPAHPLVIAGDDFGSRTYARAMVDSAAPGIRFIGFRSHEELRTLYANAALMIHPSETEGFGLVVLEAMLQRAPVALSAIGPHLEFGLPTTRYFEVGEIGAIGRLLEQSVHQSESEAFYREIEARYSLDRMVDRYAEMYRGLAGISEASSKKIDQ